MSSLLDLWFIMLSLSTLHQTHVMKTYPGLTKAVDRRAFSLPALICSFKALESACVTSVKKSTRVVSCQENSNVGGQDYTLICCRFRGRLNT